MRPLEFLPLAAAFMPIFGAFLCAATGKNAKRPFLPAVILTALEALLALLMLFLPAKEISLSFYGAFGLHMRYGGFSSLYTAVASFMWLIATLYSPMYFSHEPASGKYLFFWLFTLGATCGLFLSGDLFTAFLFFELLSLASYAWVIEEKNERAFAAGKTYLTVAVAGGMVLFMGMALLYCAVGTLSFDELVFACASTDKKGMLFAASLCLLVGFGAKAGMFPLHIWLPKAHPVAPSPASALLSGVLTKAGVFGVIVIVSRLLPGDLPFGKLLTVLGAITMVVGAVLGVLSTNLKRTLACSSVSQIGFILVGLGCFQLLSSYGHEGAEAAAVAAAGSLLHMVNHSLFKLLLFLSAGVVAAKAGSLEFDDIRGFGRKKPLFMLLFLTGCLGIGGVPLFSGYVSKTLLHDGITALARLSGRAGYTALEWIFLISGGMTVCYMAKLFTVLFIDRHPEKQALFEKTESGLKGKAGVALTAAAAAVVSMGVLPAARAAAKFSLSFFGLSPEGIDEALRLVTFSNLFSLECLKGGAISLGIGAFLFITVVLLAMRTKKGYRILQPAWLDMERFFYRPLIAGALFLLRALARFLLVFLPDALTKAALRMLRLIARVFDLPDPAVKASLGLLRFSSLSFQLFDALILLFSFRPHEKKAPDPTGIRRVDRRFGALIEKRFKVTGGAEKALRIRKTFSQTREIVLRSFSFTMAMTCIGLVGVLLYMLL